MPSKNQRAAENKAKEVRATVRDVFPVPLEQIARVAGIKIELAALSDELSGMSFIKDGVSAIILNSKHHPNRRRFTLAHELGHHFLHKSHLLNNVHVDEAVLNRNKASSYGTDPLELDANAFAAELLMPEEELIQYTSVDLNDDDALQVLARRLKVSVTALTFRLTNLRNAIS